MKSTEPMHYRVCTDCRDVIVHDYGHGSGGAIESLCYHYGDKKGEKKHKRISRFIESEQESAAEGINNPHFIWDDTDPSPKPELVLPTAPPYPKESCNPQEWVEFKELAEKYADECLEAVTEYADAMYEYERRQYYGPESEFSWSSCELCNSSLGGDRWNVWLTVLYSEDNNE